MTTPFLNILQKAKATNQKLLAVLVDPDKLDHVEKITQLAQAKNTGAILIGGSLMTNGKMETAIEKVKKSYSGPVIIFPGDVTQVSGQADGILLLSLISGRNPDLLIGKHVLAAPLLKKSGLEIIPCGYMLVNSGTPTSVEYMSNTVPIPHNKPDIAVSTAVAGEMLGLRCIYMDCGSGAEQKISDEMIQQVSSQISIPLIIGGGMKTRSQVENAWKNGATMVVVGNALEEDPELLNGL